uniref:Synaptosomal-associated protein 47 n=1 Tax=Lygus hesperus TaxID=30085 RepID=A0A0A9WG65_LYGHE
MSKSNYEYECSRAELLGLDKPEEIEFESPKFDSEELACETEQIGRVSGGLDGLNAVLDSTKKTLTRYESFNRKLGKLFHYKSKSQRKAEAEANFTSEENIPSKTEQSQSTLSSTSSGLGQSSLNFEEYQKQNDKLDSLLCKAERAELSLNRNNKLIKKLVKK